MTRYKATKDGQIAFTPDEEAEADIVQAEWVAGEPARQAIIEAEATNKADITNDELINYLKVKTLPEIEIDIADRFSVITTMTDEEIDTYIDTNVTDLASARTVLKILAKDVKAIITVLKVVVKISVYLIKKVIN